ncbi:MAG: YkvA family protein [Geodermatophilaceae bacterium]
MWWQSLVAVLGGLLLVWIVLLGLLWLTQRNHPGATGIREALRLLPDVVRLLRRLAADPSLPRGVRVRLWLLLAYLLLPIDLIPDFIPVIGYADDAIVVALALRSVTRLAGPESLTRHWPGSAEGLVAVRRLAGLDGRDAS